MVTSYIAKCTEDVTVIKTLHVATRKPGMTTEVRSLLTARDAAVRVGDMTALCSARSALSKGIKAAEGNYAGKIQGTPSRCSRVQALTKSQQLLCKL